MATPLRTVDKLTIAAARLKRAAPNLWEEFEDAFKGIQTDAALRCVQAPHDRVFVEQGRAQQLTELRDLFVNCIATADHIEAKLKGAK